MVKTRTVGTLIVAALIGLVTILFTAPKKGKKNNEEVKKERSNLFI